MPVRIIKTTLTVTVLHAVHPDDAPDADGRIARMDLADVAEVIDTGDAIGALSRSAVVEITDREEISDTLLQLGNDGTFFDIELDDDDDTDPGASLTHLG